MLENNSSLIDLMAIISHAPFTASKFPYWQYFESKKCNSDFDKTPIVANQNGCFLLTILMRRN